MEKRRDLSTSGLLLIWGDTALAGEKLRLYRPDIAVFVFFLIIIFSIGREGGREGDEGFPVKVSENEMFGKGFS